MTRKLEALLFLWKTKVWLPKPTSNVSKLPGTQVLGIQCTLMISPSTCTNTTHREQHTHKIKKIIKRYQ